MSKDFTPEEARADLAHSLSSGESTPDFWRRAHRENYNTWISGTQPVEIWTRLTVLHMLQHGRVLNIGVGTGVCTRALAGLGLQVSALDIAPEALARIEDCATPYLAPNFSTLPERSFDLALSHLVAQHMGHADLEDQARAVFRSLKSDGLFALQYVAPAEGIEQTEDSEEARRGGGVLRSPRAFAAMVERAGGRVVWDQPREQYGTTTWHVAHMKPA